MARLREPANENRPEVKAILVVEDDEDIGDFLVTALKAEIGCECLLARDGVQALEQVKTLVPDLFLLDYQLPTMNGLELYDHLHGQEELRHVPALFMSANLPVNELEKRRVYTIKKPFELEELIQQVKTLLTEPSNA